MKRRDETFTAPTTAEQLVRYRIHGVRVFDEKCGSGRIFKTEAEAAAWLDEAMPNPVTLRQVMQTATTRPTEAFALIKKKINEFRAPCNSKSATTSD
jgi:hypothetical protein